MAVQDFIDHVLNALPKWFSNRKRSYENVRAFAEIFQDVEDQTLFWRSQANILDAVGPAAGEPDWLNQHALDRGTSRQVGETDPALRDRLRTFPDALIFAALLATAQSVVDAEGIVSTVEMLELRPNRIFLLSVSSETGTGGTFAGTAPDMTFAPFAGFAPLEPKYDGVDSFKLLTSGAALGANDGLFDTTGVEGDGLAFQNALGVADVDAVVAWTIQKFDASNNALGGFQHSYLSRGHRLGGSAATLVVMLPFGCTEGTRLSVLEAFRQKKGAGVRVVVECRANP